MAEKDAPKAPPPPPTEADKARARQWFKKAAECRERRDYDYAITCFITGLNSWPEAVEEGHMPLWALAIQRAQAGGKKPGMFDTMKKSLSAKDPKEALFNAEEFMAKDPTSGSFLDAVLKNAVRAGYAQVVKWAAPKVMENLRKDAKPNMGRFKAYREALIEAADQLEAAGGGAPGDVPWLLEHAVQSLEYLIARHPGDMALKDEQRNLAGKLTIARGKYQDAESFRESIKDAEAQKLLHDTERVQQGEQTFEAIVNAARKDYQENPGVPAKITALVEVLLKKENRAEEDEAIDVLMKAYEKTQSYAFKVRADDVRMRQLRRELRALNEKAARSGSEEDRQQARLAAMEFVQTELEIARERVQMYPTDLRQKFKLGEAMFRAGQYQEAIPVLQAAAGDPRSRIRCQLLLGRAFYEVGAFSQAVDVLKDALQEASSGPTDETAKELMYWLGRSHEAAGSPDEARNAYGKLVRIDYTYRDGDARKRMDQLK